MKKSGFTLTEVLVTLTIVGVVAALALPAMINNNEKRIYGTQMQKVSTELSLALEKYMSDQHVESLAETQLYNNADKLKEFFNEYFKVKNDCGTSPTPCFGGEYYTLEGSTATISNTCSASVTFASGASLCANTTTDGDNVIAIEVDINGSQAPNMLGRDVYGFYVNKSAELVDSGSFDSDVTTAFNGSFGQLKNNNWQLN